MKTVSTLSLLALSLVLVGCNEKISPELQEGNSSTTTSGSGSGSGPTIVPDEYYLKVTNTSPLILNYKLHKTGSGNAASPCEVRSTTQFSSDNFRGNQAFHDISCFFEAEELSLLHSGFEFEIESSPNTCDFVGYSPFSYYKQIPGDSSSSFLQISCMNDTTTSAHAVTSATAMGIDIQTSAGPDTLGCNQWAYEGADIAPVARNAFSPIDDEELCRFNYPSGEQCDIGVINVRELQVTYTPAVDTTPAELKYEVVNRRVYCGGSIANCADGPVKQIDESGITKIEITNTVYDETYKKKIEYEAPLNISKTNHYYANFRKNLANTFIDFEETDTSLSSTYRQAFAAIAAPIYARTFDPKVIDFYANNRRMDGTTMVTTAMRDAVKVVNNTYVARPLAAEPFVGLAARTNPFYTFYCYDTALDIKARIRMMVRDWDRVFPTASNLELISDLYMDENARQDYPVGNEVPEDYDPSIPFNDVPDWDDIIPMSRTPGPYAAATTIWQPTPDATYTDGWFSPLLYPGY